MIDTRLVLNQNFDDIGIAQQGRVDDGRPVFEAPDFEFFSADGQRFDLRQILCANGGEHRIAAKQLQLGNRRTRKQDQRSQ